MVLMWKYVKKGRDGGLTEQPNLIKFGAQIMILEFYKKLPGMGVMFICPPSPGNVL